ncbi:MAG: hypothetical protein ACFE0P_13340 [Oceanicaulis sp.]
MGRLRRRLAISRTSAALETPFSWPFTAFLVTIGLIWALYMIFIWTALSCAETVALTFGPSRHDVAIIDLFILIFLACLSTWFFNVMRFRKVRQSWTRRGAEFLLIGFCLLVSVIWAGTARPFHPETQIAQAVRGALMRTPMFWTDFVMLETNIHDSETTDDGRTWWDDFDKNPHDIDPADFPYGIFTLPAEQCRCWSRRDESYRREHFIIDWREREGFITPVEASELRQAWPAPPTEPNWCPAALELARPGA